MCDLKTVGQYTGIKDKNGTEIYEGELVKVNGHTHLIEWNDRAAGFRLNTKGSSHAHTVFLSNIPTLEVIGNIYDNPELLEEAA